MIERENIIVVRPEKLERLLNSKEIKKEFLPGMVIVAKSICDWDGFNLCRDQDGNFVILDGESYLYRWSK